MLAAFGQVSQGEVPSRRTHTGETVRIIIGTMLAIMIAALVGLYLWQPDYVWHQKLTIDVNTPEVV